MFYSSMQNMKKIYLIACVLLVWTGVQAQQTFFPTKEGVVLVYHNYDKKGKLTGMLRYTIVQINKEGNDMDITYRCESIDTKEKLLFGEEITIKQKGDKLYFDMGGFINKEAFVREGELPVGIEISGGSMEIPLYPEPGQELPDADVKMELKLGIINLKMSAYVSNRLVEKMEEISVKAGTYDCYKLSCNVSASVLGIKSKSRVIDWYAKEIGTVKKETYDSKGNLESSTELVEARGLP